MCSVSALSTSRLLAAAAAKLYMEPKAFLVAFKKDQAQALAAFTADPTRFGRLRTYVGAVSLKANITRVKRLAKQIAAQQVQP